MTATRPRLGLPRANKLRDSRVFGVLREEGRRVVSGSLIANWRTVPEGSASRVGVIAGRKLGPAVVRNRARRLLREAFRLHQQELDSPIDLVLVARAAIRRRRFRDVEREFLGVLRRADLGQPS